MERPEAQDAGTIILTGFEPEIVLNSVRTVIEEHQQIKDKNSKNLSNLRSIPTD